MPRRLLGRLPRRLLGRGEPMNPAHCGLARGDGMPKGPAQGDLAQALLRHSRVGSTSRA